MTGLDKIIQDIVSESDSAVNAQLEKARAQAEELRSKAEREAVEQCAAVGRRAEQEAAMIRERAESAAALRTRKAVLGAKQQLIAEIIDKAKQSLYALPEDEYFKLILKMAVKYAPPRTGEILFSPADRKRLPADFEKALNEAVGGKGASLRVSGQTRNIDGGFVLSYGGIEENCSFSALFDARRDELQDKVNRLVFAGG
ncbi:V-type proton ATPase subunit E [Caprobacter fermentans]|uniref:V-type proton ATPase subunit E n=1 Tax=Caproicibacter fermentans TaxID=2576756 RepID=A0A6N8HVI2_9FIRM|nr:V-type ATP synthase subunit E family protein [Caproicibacter fermentans]MVB09796.1 V-type proton ATPase subunit E [Caproicibacter fermentans]